MSKAIVQKPSTLGFSPDQEERAAAELVRLYDVARNGLRSVIALGLFCHAIKETLPHGQFKAWLARNCTELKYNSLQSYMQLTSDVLEKCGVKLGAALKMHEEPAQLLLLPEEQIKSAPARKLRHDIFDIIDGKSQRQLFLELRNTSPRTSKGRQKVQAKDDDGASAEFAAMQEFDAISAAIEALRSKKEFGVPLYSFIKKNLLIALEGKLVGFKQELRAHARGGKGSRE